MSSPGQIGHRKPKSDSTALALMIGMVLAVAVTAAASFSAAGSGNLQQALRTLGFGRQTEIESEQRRQAAAIGQLERIISRMDNEIGGLTTRMGAAESGATATGERLTGLHGDLAALETEVSDLREHSEAAGGEGWRKPVDHLNAAVTGARTDILALRSSLDASDQARKGEVGALTKRLDRLEQAIIGRDATASIPNASSQVSRGSKQPEGDILGILGLRGSPTVEPPAGHVMDMGGAGH